MLKKNEAQMMRLLRLRLSLLGTPLLDLSAKRVRSRILCKRFTMATGVDVTRLEEVVKFWEGLDGKKKFAKDPEFDTLLVEKYSSLHADIMSGAYDSVLESSPMPGLLGAVIVLDQLSRNMFRGDARAFASDAKALALSKQAIAAGCHEIAGDSKVWFYMPFMHSEDLTDQNLCVQYFSETSWVCAQQSKTLCICLAKL